jgi:anti-sigma B factor antagonist
VSEVDIAELHRNQLYREELIRNYLSKSLDAHMAEEFEGHYLGCEECFEELSVSRTLMAALRQARVERHHVKDVVILRFVGNAELTRLSFDSEELRRAFHQNDTKVLIDLSRVTKIDSAGLGQLMSHYSHVVKNRGMLKLLKPAAEMRMLFRITRIDSVLEAYDDEKEALASF